MADAVATAQEELAQGVKRGELTRDPYRFVLGALSVTLGLFPGFVARIEAAAEGARVPLSAEEKAVFRRDLRDSLRQEAGNLARAINRRTALLSGAGAMAVALIAGTGGYLLGRGSVREEVAVLEARLALGSGASRAWLSLIQANSDPRPALTAGNSWQDQASGRRAAEVRLWLDPAAASVPPHR
ncbi:hypothetical protein [Muricoccus radiodurans]|uniref:hypothetical protein n=1 Tax=Muricoccus radiodurans TaxID=2231721 RepID=UPI003CEBEA7B